MAAFNQPLPATQPPEGISYSRGQGTNTAFGSVLSNTAETAQLGVQAVDQKIQQDIRSDAEGEVEKVRSLFGVDAATPQEVGLPPELQKGKDYISRLQQGYIAGTVKDSHYTGNLNSVVKSLKSKYPGYSEQVDNIIRDITGITPANALVADLAQEAKAAAENLDYHAKFRMQFIKDNMNYLKLADPNFFNKTEEEQGTIDQLMSMVSNLQAKQLSMKMASDELAFGEAIGELAKKDVLMTARDNAQTIGAAAMSGALTGAGITGGQSIQKAVDKANLDGSISPEEQVSITQQANVLKLKVAFDVDNMIMGLPGSERLDKQEREDIKDIAMAPVNAILDSLNNEDTGLFKATAIWLDATKKKAQEDLLRNGGHDFSMIIALRELMGETAFGVWATQNETQMSTFSNALSMATQAKILTDPSVSFDEALGQINPYNKSQPGATVDPSIAGKILGETIKTMTSLDMPIEMQLASASKLYSHSGGFNFARVKPEQRVPVYFHLVNARNSKHVRTLADVAGDELFNDYFNFAEHNLGLVAQSDLSAIANMPKDVGLDVQYNTNTGQFSLTGRNPTGVLLEANEQAAKAGRTTRPMGEASGMTIIQQNYAATVHRVNALLRSLQTVYKESDVVKAPGVQAALLLKSLGLNLEVINMETSGLPSGEEPPADLLEQYEGTQGRTPASDDDIEGGEGDDNVDGGAANDNLNVKTGAVIGKGKGVGAFGGEGAMSIGGRIDMPINNPANDNSILRVIK